MTEFLCRVTYLYVRWPKYTKEVISNRAVTSVFRHNCITKRLLCWEENTLKTRFSKLLFTFWYFDIHKIVRHSSKEDCGIRTVACYRFLTYKSNEARQHCFELRITSLNSVRNLTNHAVRIFIHALNSNRGLRSYLGILHIHNICCSTVTKSWAVM